VEQLNSLLSLLKEKYSQQGQAGKILIPSLGLFLFCCLCLLLFRLVSAGARNSPGITPSPILPTIAGAQPTPTALFGFGSSPFPTLVAPSPLPMTPGPATATAIPTQTALPATATLISTNTSVPPTASGSGSVRITTVNKSDEYVDIQNIGNGPVDLEGWRLVSETGDQSCILKGILQPNDSLRVWARTGTSGFNCGYLFNIWNDNQADPAVLYDPQEKEISSYP
jgi:hypothetical protein